MEDGNDQGTSGQRAWWIDALDPARNLRTITDARVAGRRIADDFADQLLGGADGRWPGASATGDGANGDGANGADTGPGSGDVEQALRTLRADAAHVGDASMSFIEHAFALLGVLARRLPGPGEGPGTKPLAVGPLAPGDQVSEVFWVHNTSATPVASVRPHCGTPRSDTGAELAAEVSFDPPALDPLPARSSCGIELRVRVAGSAEPGTYASLIMATNAPGWFLPVSVTVAVPDPPDPPDAPEPPQFPDAG